MASILPPDDRPSSEATAADRDLRRSLERAVERYVYETCEGMVQALLLKCRWSITTESGFLSLVIDCPDADTYERVLNHLVPLAQSLARFSLSARIQVGPPIDGHDVWEIRINELPIYQDDI